MSTKKVGITIMVLAVVFLIFGAACNAASRPSTGSTPVVGSDVAIVTGGVVPPVVVSSAPPAGPTMTANQASAVRKGQSYLEYQGFSKTGLIKQLKFEKFSTADATFAANNVTVDWMAEAAEKAESYMSFQSFSRDGLIKQLKFEGFTTAEATHGADTVGLK